MRQWRLLLIPLVIAACTREATPPTAPLFQGVGPAVTPGLDRLQHIVVIYLENHSFDNLYGEFPGANGLAAAAATSTQMDAAGNPFVTLPFNAGSPFPSNLPNAPFNIEQFVPADQKIPDLVHRYYQEQSQIDGGRMDKFALISDAKGEVMGFYHTAGLPLAAEAANYTLCDNFFHAAFGGSFLNHFWLIAARTPVFPGAPAAPVGQLDGSGALVRGGCVPPAQLFPNQTFATIGDRLSEKNISWAWYSGGWNDALAGNAGPLFQFHHQPFIYFANYADGPAAKAEHLKDEQDFLAALATGRLPE